LNLEAGEASHAKSYMYHVIILIDVISFESIFWNPDEDYQYSYMYIICGGAKNYFLEVYYCGVV
jgi:hypothetical protein